MESDSKWKNDLSIKFTNDPKIKQKTMPIGAWVCLFLVFPWFLLSK